MKKRPERPVGIASTIHDPQENSTNSPTGSAFCHVRKEFVKLDLCVNCEDGYKLHIQQATIKDRMQVRGYASAKLMAAYCGGMDVRSFEKHARANGVFPSVFDGSSRKYYSYTEVTAMMDRLKEKPSSMSAERIVERMTQPKKSPHGIY